MGRVLVPGGGEFSSWRGSQEGLQVIPLFSEEGEKIAQALPPCFHRPVRVGVKLQTDIAGVPALTEGPESTGKIHRSLAGNQMVMSAVLADVLDVNVADPGEKVLKGPARVLSDAEEVPQVEIETDPRRPDPPDEFLELLAVFQEQARFGFHQDLYA